MPEDEDESPPLDDFYHPTPIPEELHSEYEERAFKSCTRCGETLEDFDDGFQIAKVFRGGEAVFEYALCAPCHTGLVDDFSVESRKTLEQFYRENMKPGLGAQVCGICATARTDLSQPEFALGAACRGSYLLEAFMVCSDCMEKTNALVSKETQDKWGDFIDDNFPGVPADALPDPAGVPFF